MDRACAGLVQRLVERMPEDWAQEDALRAACAADVERHCPYTPSGYSRLHQCLRCGNCCRFAQAWCPCAHGLSWIHTLPAMTVQAYGGHAALRLPPAARRRARSAARPEHCG